MAGRKAWDRCDPRAARKSTLPQTESAQKARQVPKAFSRPRYTQAPEDLVPCAFIPTLGFRLVYWMPLCCVSRKAPLLGLGEQICLARIKVHGHRYVFLHNQPMAMNLAIYVGNPDKGFKP